MAAPIGNTNARGGTEFRNAIRRALKTYAAKSVRRGKALEAIAHKVIGMAVAGDIDAIKFLADRIDGRATQPIEFDATDAASRIRITLPHNGRCDPALLGPGVARRKK